MMAAPQRIPWLLVAGLVTTLALGACGDDKSGKSGAFPGSEMAKFVKAGFKAGKLESIKPGPYSAHQCSHGKVGGLKVLLCRYGSAEEAKKAEAKLLRFVGASVTGAVRIRGKIAFAVADSDKTDLRGKKINRLLQAFAPSGAPPKKKDGTALDLLK
jgi:hypothetical protein